ncbi:hypothetical protein IW150_006883 [Coemansia sp. RSA 2607]|nr:hypothetical protein IW150_006883 [Coemansia sp. RSA 2607]
MTYLGPRPLTTTTVNQPTAGPRPAPTQPQRIAAGTRTAPAQPQRIAAGTRTAPAQPQRVATGNGPAPAQPQRIAAGTRTAPAQSQRVAAGTRTAPAQPQRVATGNGPAPAQPQRVTKLDGCLLAFTAMRNAAKVAFWRKEAQSYDRECCELMNMLASAETRAWDLAIELADERDAHLKVQSRLQLAEKELVALRLAAARAAGSSNTRIIAESEAAEHARFSAKFAHVQPYVTITD